MNTYNLYKLYPWLCNQDWQLVSGNQQFKLINNYSQQVFVLTKITPTSDHILESLQYRSAYSIPHTPKIILPLYQPDPLVTEVLVQRQQSSIWEMIKKINSDFLVLEKLKQVIKVVEALTRKYGYFKITDNMVKISKQGQIMIWVNQRWEFSVRKYPILVVSNSEAVKMMMIGLIEIFGKGNTKQVLNLLKYQIQTEKIISSFVMVIQLIDKLIVQSQLTPKNQQIRPIPQFLKNKVRCYRPQIANSMLTNNHQLNGSRLLKTSSQQQFSSCRLNPQMMPNTRNEVQLKQSLMKIKSEQKIPISKNSFRKFIGNQREQIRMNHDKQFKQFEDSREQMCKKNFRESSNSVSTAHCHNSSLCQGKIFEDQNSHYSFNQNSFGPITKNEKESNKRDNKMLIKISKIIEENHYEDGTQNSHDNTQENLGKSQFMEKMNQSELQRDFHDLLFHDASHSQINISKEFQLQEEFMNILS